MNAPLNSLLATLAASHDVESYLVAQERAAALATASYEDLLSAASAHPDPAIRFEALHLLSLLATPGHQAALERARATDPDPTVRSFAEALVFRFIVSKRVLASGKLDSEGYAAYRRNVFREAAQVIIRSRY